MFLGTFSPRLDDKNRLILPAKWRSAFDGGIVMTRGQERCVFAFPRAAFETLVDELAGAPLTNKDAREYARMLLAGAQDEVPDKQGRVTVAPLLREYAGHYNAARPHRALRLQPPLGPPFQRATAGAIGAVCRRERLGGLLHEYERTAA